MAKKTAMPDETPDNSGLAKVESALAYPVLTSSQKIGTWLREALQGEALSLNDLDRIKIPAAGGQMWTFQKNGEDVAVKTLRGILVHHQIVRLYWQDAYGSTGQTQPPDCSSKDGRTGVGNPGGACITCQFAQWGSKDGDGDGNAQACQLRRLLFLLLEGEYLPRVISAPPTGVQSSKKYTLGLVMEGTKHNRVITEIGLTKAQSGGGIPYSAMTFRMAGRISEDEAAKAEIYGQHLSALIGGAMPGMFADQEGDTDG